MAFQFEIIEKDGVPQVNLMGRLDNATSGDFEKSLQSLFNKTVGLALMDFSSLNYISSSGLRVILIAAKHAKQANGRLILFGLQPHVREVFQISGLLKILDVVDERSDALR